MFAIRAATLTAMGVALTLGAIATGPAMAQDYPEREIRLFIPFPAGGSTDIVGRIAANALSERLGQPVVIENRGGAGGTVGTQAVSTQPADGYTLTISTTSTHVVGPTVHDNLAYDPVDGFTHIGLIAETPYVMVVNNELDVESVQDVIDLATEQPGFLNYGSAGQGSTTHLAAEMFIAATGVEMEHIPYPGNQEATTAVMSGEVDVLFGSMPAVLSQIRSESITALAVGTTERSSQLPDTPTMQEAGVDDYRASLWLAFAGPEGIPDDIVERLHEEIVSVIEDEAVREQLVQNGAEPITSTPEELRDLIVQELETYGSIVESIDITE